MLSLHSIAMLGSSLGKGVFYSVGTKVDRMPSVEAAAGIRPCVCRSPSIVGGVATLFGSNTIQLEKP